MDLNTFSNNMGNKSGTYDTTYLQVNLISVYSPQQARPPSTPLQIQSWADLQSVSPVQKRFHKTFLILIP